MPQITQLPDIFASQLFWLGLALAFIFFVVALGMVPRVRSVVDDRKRKVAEDLERANAARAEAEAISAEWNAHMESARQEAARLAHEARRASALELEQRLNTALRGIDKKVKASQRRIRTALAEARKEIDGVAAEAAQEIVERLTGINVDREAAEAAVHIECYPPATARTPEQISAEVTGQH